MCGVERGWLRLARWCVCIVTAMHWWRLIVGSTVWAEKVGTQNRRRAPSTKRKIVGAWARVLLHRTRKRGKRSIESTVHRMAMLTHRGLRMTVGRGVGRVSRSPQVVGVKASFALLVGFLFELLGLCSSVLELFNILISKYTTNERTRTHPDLHLARSHIELL